MRFEIVFYTLARPIWHRIGEILLKSAENNSNFPPNSKSTAAGNKVKLKAKTHSRKKPQINED